MQHLPEVVEEENSDFCSSDESDIVEPDNTFYSEVTFPEEEEFLDSRPIRKNFSVETKNSFCSEDENQKTLGV